MNFCSCSNCRERRYNNWSKFSFESESESEDDIELCTCPACRKWTLNKQPKLTSNRKDNAAELCNCSGCRNRMLNRQSQLLPDLGWQYHAGMCPSSMCRNRMFNRQTKLQSTTCKCGAIQSEKQDNYQSLFCGFVNYNVGLDIQLEQAKLKLPSKIEKQIASQRELEEADAEIAFQLQLVELTPSAASHSQPILPAITITKCDARMTSEWADSEYDPNDEPFDCPVCFVKCDTSEGVRLQNCCHTFCKECIANVVKHSDEAEIKCPFTDGSEICDGLITDREIRALVSCEQYEKHLQQSLRVAESTANSFHCRTTNCKGFCFFEQSVNVFVCPVCKADNCLICRVYYIYLFESLKHTFNIVLNLQAIHAGFNCKQYQDSIHLDTGSVATNCVLAEMIRKGEAMKCPKCQVIMNVQLYIYYIRLRPLVYL